MITFAESYGSTRVGLRRHYWIFFAPFNFFSPYISANWMLIVNTKEEKKTIIFCLI